MTISTTSFEEIRVKGDELRALLASLGITLSPASVFAEALRSVDEAIGFWKAQILPTDDRTDRLISDLVAVDALGCVAKTIKRLKALPVGLPERLRAIAGGDPRVTSTGDQSAERDAIFELLCWHVCMQFADDVAFDEPDIRCAFDGLGLGLACKAHYGRTDRAVQAIRKGWKQILRSAVQEGLVIVHLTNHFPRDQMTRRRPDGTELVAATEETLDALFKKSLQTVSRPIEDGLRRSLHRHPKEDHGRVHGILYVAHTIATFQKWSTRIGGIVYQPMNPKSSLRVRPFVDGFNAFWQDLSCAGLAAR